MLCRDAKPNKGELAILRQVIKLPPSKPLANHQKAQVSKFRYYLAKQSGTIIPFLKAVEWTNSQVGPSLSQHRLCRPTFVDQPSSPRCHHFPSRHPATAGTWRKSSHPPQQPPDCEMPI